MFILLAVHTDDTCAGSGLALLTRGHLERMAVDCSAGFEYLASLKYVHRDIAARNVVLSATCVAKIGDFGMALSRCICCYPV
jgi:serine/threonine protein kinase